ncbi:MAG: hypothetical protein WDN72_10965 [Alphaproteobacteria bacterium]
MADPVAKEQFRQAMKVARRPAGRLLLISFVFALLPIPFLVADHSADPEAKAILMGLFVLSSLFLQLLSHFIAAKIGLLRSLFRAKSKYHLVDPAPPGELKPYFWRWYAYFWCGFALLIVASIALSMVDKDGKAAGSGGLALILFYTINLYSITGLVTRLVRDGKASFPTDS